MAAPIASLRVDSPGPLLLVLGLWLLFGLYCLVAGFADLYQRRLPWRLWGDRGLSADQWRGLLRSWDIIGPRDTDTDLPSVVGRAWTLATSYKAIVLGLLIWLEVLCYLGAGLILQHLSVPDSATGFFGLMLPVVGGNLGGHLAGVARLRARPGHALSPYGDPRPRRLGDYRSPVYFVWSFAFAALQLGLTFLAVRPVTTAWSIYPLLSLAVVVCTEILLRFVTQEPRLPLLSEPARARRLDDMVRSQTLTTIQGSGLYFIGFLGLMQGALIDQGSGTNGWVIAIYGTCVASFAAGAVTFQYLRGWMGGTVTGWRWQKGSKRNGPAAARP